MCGWHPDVATYIGIQQEIIPPAISGYGVRIITPYQSQKTDGLNMTI
jgi:hypothetical protein